MLSFKTININKSNYKDCCLCSSKELTAFVKTSLAILIVLVIPASFKFLNVESFCFLILVVPV